MHRVMWTVASAMLAVVLLLAATPVARAHDGDNNSGRFPELISLPVGFQPEGIVGGRGTTLYAGSLADGAIYAADARTGKGRVLVHGTEGRIAVGLSYDNRSNYIFAAGGTNGNAFVYDGRTGAEVGAFQFTPAQNTFINDVVVTNDAAYFTNSSRAEFYRVPLGPGGRLPTAGVFETIPLGGDFVQQQGFNANGIEATPNGKTLFIAQSVTGTIFNVDPRTGVARAIDLGGARLSNADGLLLQGKSLFVVRNRLNLVVEVKLDNDLLSGEVEEEFTNPNFNVPTTAASVAGRLYAVNAKFGTAPAGTPYEIVRFGESDD